MDAWQLYLSKNAGKQPRNAFDLVNVARSSEIELTLKEAKQLYNYNNIRNKNKNDWYDDDDNDEDDDDDDSSNDNDELNRHDDDIHDDEGDSISDSSIGQKWKCDRCTYLNHAAMTYCEQCNHNKPGYIDHKLIQQFKPEPEDKDQTHCYCCGILACIVVIVVIIIIIIIILIGNAIADSINYCDADCQEGRRSGSSDCCVAVEQEFNSQKEWVCGILIENTVQEQDCTAKCKDIYYGYASDIQSAYYIRNVSECYCKYMTDYIYNYEDYTKKGYDYEDCFNYSDFEVVKWELDCCDDYDTVDGRPYIINTNENKHLKSHIKYIDCNNYTLYDDAEWMEFIRNSNVSNNEMFSKWQTRGLLEHASIGTFAKFSLQLLSIGSPLWFIELSDKAGLDEIRHTQISFDIANMYLDPAICIITDTFPQHVVNIDGDWDRISKDTAIGGCIGETMAAFRMIETIYHNIIDQYVMQMAMDEIRHSALAWITIKWMIDNVPDDIHMDIQDINWWNQQIIRRKQSVSNTKEIYIYDVIITSILNKLWINCTSYKDLYTSIIEELRSELNIIIATECSSI